MKNILILLPIVFSLIGCDAKDEDKTKDLSGYKPDYVIDAKSDVRNAIVANVIKNPDFECNSLILHQQVYWSIACFIPGNNPIPFLLFEVQSDPSESNPPFKYKLIAVNGKAKQYAEKQSLRFLKIDTTSSSTIDVDSAIDEYVKAYPPK